ncbi:MerR family transcriptional regulator [Niallia sp. NCCP-28]|uniref:MerR family transcriptional regulator n=1 Tax=Niallia sp. NCCP-28 TaxID=2934712 RepID=UPI002085F89F|nr:MerR family transcriptional regulator [Niallia sp. NCCP-28]GKU85303.1 hypothetical protein NCCP28_46990 [Niallia sp. NCCP-28]
MATYKGKEIEKILQAEGIDIPLRTIRYYTQIGLLPLLELVGNQRVYTNKHLHYLRAILILQKAGDSLSAIGEELASLSLSEVENIGSKLPFYQKERIIEQEVYQVNEDVFLTMNRNISGELKEQMIHAVSNMLKDSSH